MDDWPMSEGTTTVERVFRQEYGRLIASLVRRFGTRTPPSAPSSAVNAANSREARNLSQAVVSAAARS
jgi:hypothetical protein